MNILLIILTLLLCSFALAAVSLAPWVPCRTKDLERIFKLAKLKKNEVFYDLGCGDGKTIFYANKHFGVKSIGLELALPMFLVCKIRQIFYRNKNIQFKYKNLFKENLSNANAIYVYGMKDSLKNQLKDKLIKELKSGTRVISYVFPIEGLEKQLIEKNLETKIPIYLYQF